MLVAKASSGPLVSFLALRAQLAPGTEVLSCDLLSREEGMDGGSGVHF